MRSPLKDVALILAQSAMLETVFTLVYVITVGLGSPMQNAFLPILGQVQVKMHLPSGHLHMTYGIRRCSPQCWSSIVSCDAVGKQ